MNAAIIGCGNIGCLFNENYKDKILTHAEAYTVSKKIALKALSDINIDRVREAGKAYNVKNIFTDYRRMLGEQTIDVLSICTPASERLNIIDEALKSGIKTIFCEKPVAASLSEAQSIIALKAKHNANIIINYTRRWDNAIIKIKELLKSGAIGKILMVNSYYNKGLLGNGSHLIDMYRYLWGEPITSEPFGYIGSRHGDNDESINFILKYNNPNESEYLIYSYGIKETNYSIWEMDIIGENGRIMLKDKGLDISYQLKGPDPVFRGYTTLGKPVTVKSGYGKAMLNAVNQVADVASGKEKKSYSDIEDAVKNMVVIDNITKQIPA